MPAVKPSPFKKRGTCKPGQRSDLTGCVPADGSVGYSTEQSSKKPLGQKKPRTEPPYKPTIPDDQVLRHTLVNTFRQEVASYNEGPLKSEMSLGDQLRALDLTFELRQTKSKYHQVELKKSPFTIRDELEEQSIDIDKLDNDSLWDVLNKKGYILSNPSFTSRKLQAGIRSDHILEHATPEERKILLPYLAKRLAETEGMESNGFWYGEVPGLSPEEAVLWADSLEEVAEGAPLKTQYDGGKVSTDYDSGLTRARVHSWEYTKNYDVFLSGFAQNWSIAGSGVPAQRIANLRGKDVFEQNNGKQFFTKFTGASDSDPRKGEHSPERIASHLQRLKKATEEFYKKKLGKKQAGTFDLSQAKIKLKRGVGGAVDAYLPSPCESWTADNGTAERFGKMMKTKAYTILEAEVSYNDILFSYETMKNVPGWPAEKRLKGKKEFVVLGGALQDIDAEVKY